MGEEENRQNKYGKYQYIIQDDLEYAEDTQLLIGNDTREQMCV